MSESKRIIILVHNDFQDMEVMYPFLRLKEEEYEVLIAGPNKTQITGKYGYPVNPDMTFDEINTNDVDAIVIPGGWAPDFLRLEPKVLSSIQEMNKQKKIIASICHGGWVLASSKIINKRKLTSYIAIKDDMENAGSDWVDEEVVIDNNLITSRTPNDLPTFVKMIILKLNEAEGE